MKRFLALLLILTLLFSFSPFLYSCSDDDEDVISTRDDDEDEDEDEDEEDEDGGFFDAIIKPDNNHEQTAPNEENFADSYEESSIFAERAEVSDRLGDFDYGGRDFRVVCMNYAEDSYVASEEKLNQGDLLVDAKHAASQKVATRFNTDFKIVYSGTYSEIDDYVQKTVLAAADEFDLMDGMTMSMGGLVTKDLFLDWGSIEHVDFSRPWWYESNSTELTYDCKAIIAISHLNSNAVTGAYCLYFNKDLAAAYDLGNLYEVVLAGDWTFDYFTDLISEIYVDNGNDVRDENDIYGMVQGIGTGINSYLWAFDNSVCKKNSEGVPEVSVMTDKIDSIVNAVYDFCFNTNGVYCDPNGSSGGYSAYVEDMFFSKKAIFMQGTLGTATNEDMRNFDSDYGILPLPKWDKNQSKYMTSAIGAHTALAVPKTVRDTEFVGRIVEALSAESWKLVTPTLYETALKTRYLRDSESKEVMDIIIEGTQFDFGTVYDNWKGFAFMLSNLIQQQNPNFRSYYARGINNAKAQLKKTIKAFDKLG